MSGYWPFLEQCAAVQNRTWNGRKLVKPSVWWLRNLRARQSASAAGLPTLDRRKML